VAEGLRRCALNAVFTGSNPVPVTGELMISTPIKRKYFIGGKWGHRTGPRQMFQTFPRCPLDPPETKIEHAVKIGSDYCEECYFCDGIDRENQIVFCECHDVSTNAWWFRDRERRRR
jgi:hypothetical protein